METKVLLSKNDDSADAWAGRGMIHETRAKIYREVLLLVH